MNVIPGVQQRFSSPVRSFRAGPDRGRGRSRTRDRSGRAGAAGSLAAAGCPCALSGSSEKVDQGSSRGGGREKASPAQQLFSELTAQAAGALQYTLSETGSPFEMRRELLCRHCYVQLCCFQSDCHTLEESLKLARNAGIWLDQGVPRLPGCRDRLGALPGDSAPVRPGHCWCMRSRSAAVPAERQGFL